MEANGVACRRSARLMAEQLPARTSQAWQEAAPGRSPAGPRGPEEALAATTHRRTGPL